MHECIVTECSNHLGKYGADVLDLFDMTSMELSSAKLSDFGDTEYIRYRIEQELRNQFVTQKQNLLKILHSYVSETEFGNQTSDFSFFGTNVFNMVWEKACSVIFDDVKDKKIGELEQKEKIKFVDFTPNESTKNSTLKTFIERVRWNFGNNVILPNETLEPDIITVSEKSFYILDGKYYLINHDEKDIKNNPGIQDVIKQFAYNKAYHEFLQTTEFEEVGNCFLIPMIYPCKKNNIKFSGTAELDLMQNFTMEGLCPISLIELNPDYVFKNYLTNRKIMNDFTEQANEIKTKLILKKSISTFEWQKHYMPELKYTMVGLIRNSKVHHYLDDIIDAVEKNKEKATFLFFFYKEKRNREYPVHNLLPCCDKFIGYNPKSDKLIKGLIQEIEIKEDRKIRRERIRVLKKEVLLEELDSLNYKNVTNGSADLYYVVKINTIEITERKKIPSLENLIINFDGNDILSDYSPKVIMLDEF